MILHLDMDAFYAAIEQRDDPALQGRPVVVGGRGRRAVVAAASYEARRFGVRSAMPMFEARRRCPQAVVVAPRMDRYREVSRTVMGILREFSPLVEPVSIDEAFVDLAGTERLWGPPEAVAAAIKERIRAALGLTASIGVAPVRFLAKIASDLHKPDGLTVIAPEAVAEVIDRLPVGRVPGVGPKTQAKLAAMGVEFLGALRAFPPETLAAAFGSAGARLLALARGIDPTPVTPATPARSVSSECTLPADTREEALIARCLLEQAEEVAAALRRQGVAARTVVLKLKHADFTVRTRRTTFAPATQSSKELYRRALALLAKHRPAQKVRLVGLGATGLTAAAAPRQQELFGAPEGPRKAWEAVDRAVDRIRERFGDGVIGRGTLKGE
jgi:DNA polymerase-4